MEGLSKAFSGVVGYSMRGEIGSVYVCFFRLRCRGVECSERQKVRPRM